MRPICEIEARSKGEFRATKKGEGQDLRIVGRELLCGIGTGPRKILHRLGKLFGPRKNSFLRRKMVIARLKSDEERVILGTVLSLPHKNVIRSL